jgi:hypothetical protein
MFTFLPKVAQHFKNVKTMLNVFDGREGKKTDKFVFNDRDRIVYSISIYVKCMFIFYCNCLFIDQNSSPINM